MEETIVHEAERRAEAGDWGGRAPSPKLREVGGNKWGLSSLDRDLVDAVNSADAATQRVIARWAVSYAVARAELHTFYTFARAIRALRVGEEIPVPLGDRAEVWEWFFAQRNLPHTFVRPLHGSGGEVLQQAMAVIALFAAVQKDPLRASSN
ncbi:hypothetical protein QNO07_21250 [Streptomyces sp. 549]|uniref:hypothetical protein n=1 Tax=Streptomyces sp. 549 TaxID=3049076 RepID=UPI0024C22715|nr:hypothetical protein [Streptomyces sp. 549]MDK1475910.1 hypothetical protein [Streptomyces sp. 549]